jgi:hypothetical protein
MRFRLSLMVLTKAILVPSGEMTTFSRVGSLPKASSGAVCLARTPYGQPSKMADPTTAARPVANGKRLRFTLSIPGDTRSS